MDSLGAHAAWTAPTCSRSNSRYTLHQPDQNTAGGSGAIPAYLWSGLPEAEYMITLPAGRPGEASGAVAALIALITPLPYSSDFRPFFTIHDPAFNDMAAQSLPSSSNSLPWLLGVTNLYIIKVLSEM